MRTIRFLTLTTALDEGGALYGGTPPCWAGQLRHDLWSLAFWRAGNPARSRLFSRLGERSSLCFDGDWVVGGVFVV